MKKYLAEFLAVFFVVFLAAGAIVADQELSVVQVRDSFGPLGVALAYGLAYAITLMAFTGLTDGYANPAISLAFYIARRITIKDLGGYLAADLLGAILAGLAVARIFPADAVEAVGAGVPALGPTTTFVQGGIIEIVLTFILVFVLWGVVVDTRRPSRRVPLAIGLTVIVGVLTGAPFTGGIMNPARWIGPAVASAQFDNWPVWILGPIVGALMASAAYELAFLGRETGEPEVLDEPAEASSLLIDSESSTGSGRPPAESTAPSPAAHVTAEEEVPPPDRTPPNGESKLP